jgi:hypothetical protein
MELKYLSYSQVLSFREILKKELEEIVGTNTSKGMMDVYVDSLITYKSNFPNEGVPSEETQSDFWEIYKDFFEPLSHFAEEVA